MVVSVLGEAAGADGRRDGGRRAEEGKKWKMKRRKKMERIKKCRKRMIS